MEIRDKSEANSASTFSVHENTKNKPRTWRTRFIWCALVHGLPKQNNTSGMDAKPRKTLVIINLMNLKTKASKRENKFRGN